jgi:hypothetical protein
VSMLAHAPLHACLPYVKHQYTVHPAAWCLELCSRRWPPETRLCPPAEGPTLRSPAPQQPPTLPPCSPPNPALLPAL